MLFYSTLNKEYKVSFRQALLQGLPSDKGLFMPAFIPKLNSAIINNIEKYSFKEIALFISKEFMQDEIDNSNLEMIIDSSISFNTPLVEISKQVSILELFHGPTLAFKDFGARFMARTMQYFLKDESQEITILVATSGDTGSAVANGFLNVEGINVIVLYPKNKISKIQEKQITTLNNNIIPLEIDGTFDDCQRLVKSAFVDPELKGKIRLSSANSINIGRLIPQSFYYFEGYKQHNVKRNVVFCVPSGNLGNLTAGLIAMKMGLPVKKFIAATNENDVFTNYIKTGIYSPRNSKVTLSNAMDVGDPSNFFRILDLFKNDHSLISHHIYSKSFDDNKTLKKIQYIYYNNNYIIDPHGAVGCLAMDDYLSNCGTDTYGIVLETAHPSKFMDVFTNNLDFKPDIPERLASCLNKKGNVIRLSNSYFDFKEYLIN